MFIEDSPESTEGQRFELWTLWNNVYSIAKKFLRKGITLGCNGLQQADQF